MAHILQTYTALKLINAHVIDLYYLADMAVYACIVHLYYLKILTSATYEICLKNINNTCKYD